MRASCLLLAAALPGAVAIAQPEMSVFNATGRAAATTFVTDYQAVGINPANLGWRWRHEGKRVAIGLAEGSYSAHSDALTRNDIRHRLLDTDFRFNQEQKVEAGRIFADAGVTAQMDLMLFGAALTTENAGGFAFQVRDRAQVSSRFGPLTAELAFIGYRSDYFDLLVLVTGDTISNYADMSVDSLALIALGIATEPRLLSRVLDGSHLRGTWYREFNFSYGHHLVRNDEVEVHLGIGLKYLLGVGIGDIVARDGRASGFTALTSSLDIDYQTGERRPGARLSPGAMLFPEPAGTGFGLDLGMSMIIGGKWRVGASVCDIGAITWTGNVYTARDGDLIDLATAGLENYNLIHGIEDFATNSGFLDWEAGQRTKRPLPAMGRFGLGRTLGDRVELGAEVALPLNEEPGSLASPVVGVGGDVRPVEWLQLSTGLSAGGGYGLKVPVGITFIVGNGTWEAGFASRDVVSFFTRPHPTLSLSMGFLRFRL
ncbi:MAG: DUF5723 family protein [Flavobacteriales bacterium]|jgi:hypothetical protein|nr:DUF5723 family protein [Flavobacteriales bacterium]